MFLSLLFMLFVVCFWICLSGIYSLKESLHNFQHCSSQARYSPHTGWCKHRPVLPPVFVVRLCYLRRAAMCNGASFGGSWWPYRGQSHHGKAARGEPRGLLAPRSGLWFLVRRLDLRAWAQQAASPSLSCLAACGLPIDFGSVLPLFAE